MGDPFAPVRRACLTKARVFGQRLVDAIVQSIVQGELSVPHNPDEFMVQWKQFVDPDIDPNEYGHWWLSVLLHLDNQMILSQREMDAGYEGTEGRIPLNTSELVTDPDYHPFLLNQKAIARTGCSPEICGDPSGCLIGQVLLKFGTVVPLSMEHEADSELEISPYSGLVRRAVTGRLTPFPLFSQITMKPRVSWVTSGKFVFEKSGTPEEAAQLEILRASLTLSSRYRQTPRTMTPPLVCFVETATHFGVPRFVGLKLWGRPTRGGLCPGTPTRWASSPDPVVPLRPGPQPEAISAIVQSWKKFGGALAVLPTGEGKTVVGVAAAQQAGMLTMVVSCQPKTLLPQWESEFRRFLPSVEIGYIWGAKTVLSATTQVILASAQTLHNRLDVLGEWVERIGLTIFDEVHCFPAQELMKMMVSWSGHWVLGLTATPHRDDGLGDGHLEWWVGPCAIHYEDVNREECPLSVHMIELPESRDLFTDKERTITPAQCNAYLINLWKKRLSDDPVRNRVLCRYLLSELRSGHYTLVLTFFVEHANFLRDALLREMPDASVAVLHGDVVDEEERERAKNDVQMTIATDRSAGIGYNVPRLDSLVLALPCSASIQQYVGRIRRRSPDKNALFVVDFWDRGLPLFEGQARKRLHFYEVKKYAVKLGVEHGK